MIEKPDEVTADAWGRLYVFPGEEDPRDAIHEDARDSYDMDMIQTTRDFAAQNGVVEKYPERATVKWWWSEDSGAWMCLAIIWCYSDSIPDHE